MLLTNSTILNAKENLNITCLRTFSASVHYVVLQEDKVQKLEMQRLNFNPVSSIE